MIRPKRVSVITYSATTLGAGLIYDALVPRLFRHASPHAVLWGLVVTCATVMTLLACYDERRPRWLWDRR